MTSQIFPNYENYIPVRSLSLLEAVYQKIQDSKQKYSEPLILPKQNYLFRAFELCPLNILRIVIVGQDPYPQPGYATGLAFANPPNTSPISPSLELIKNRVEKDFTHLYSQPTTFDITLESWAKQGVLLLNSSLTVIANHPGSHTSIWYPFISSLLTELSKQGNLIFILFGSNAISMQKLLYKKNNSIFAYKHPAYYARLGQEFECDGFIKAKSRLNELGQDIDFLNI